MMRRSMKLSSIAEIRNFSSLDYRVSIGQIPLLDIYQNKEE